MSRGLTSPGVADFPEPNLGPSAQRWARTVMQRIAQLEDKGLRHDDGIHDANKGVISAIRRAGRSDFNFRDDWVAQTVGTTLTAFSVFGSSGPWDPNVRSDLAYSAGTQVVNPAPDADTGAPAHDPSSAIQVPNYSGEAFFEWTLAAPLPTGGTLFADYEFYPVDGSTPPVLLFDGVQQGWTLPTDSTPFWQGGEWLVPAGTQVIRWQHGGAAYGVLWLDNPRISYSQTGPPSGGESYRTGDVVRHNGGTWLAVNDPQVGDEPGATTSWKLVAQNGLNFMGDYGYDS